MRLASECCRYLCKKENTSQWYPPCDHPGRVRTTAPRPPAHASRCPRSASPWTAPRRAGPVAAPWTPQSAPRHGSASAGTLWRRSARGRGNSAERRGGYRCSSLRWCSSPRTGSTETLGRSWGEGRMPAPCPGWSLLSGWSVCEVHMNSQWKPHAIRISAGHSAF